VRILGIERPSAVYLVSRGGRRELTGLRYDAGAKLLTIDTPSLGTKRGALVTLDFGEPARRGGGGGGGDRQAGGD
jgi:hypothetical protein